MKNLPCLAVLALLTACGGSDSSTAPSTPPAQQPPTLTLSSPTIRTIAGGSAIALGAKLSSGGAVRWQLDAGAPGSLSAASGDSVRYLPPAGSLAAPAVVGVSASGDGASAALKLAVTPDPGPAGAYPLAWRTDTSPIMLRPIDLAADVAGNVYALLQIDAIPTRRGPPRLVKIAPDGAITELIGATWFGQPYSNETANRIFFTSGFAVGRTGDLYIAVRGGSGFGVEIGQQAPSGPAILKITPAGDMSVVAGSEGPQVGAITDGTGAAARFSYPRIVGIDLDDNVYLFDRNDMPRKVTPAGVVTTLSALPAGLNADMNGNTYRYDAATQKLMRVAPDGTASVETSAPYCADVAAGTPCIGAAISAIVPTGGASFALLGSQGIVRLVLRR